MSAYIVDKATIDAIVTWALGGYNCRCITVKVPPGLTVKGSYGGHCLANEIPADTIGQLLWDENYHSVNYRYSETDSAPVYKYKSVTAIKVAHSGNPKIASTYRQLTPSDIIKIIDCLDYQSCEHPEWHESWACDFLRRVKDAATDKLIPDSAPWGLKNHEAA